MQDEIPESVRKLIADHVTSIEQLEILLLLMRGSGVEWTAKTVSDEIRTSERSASDRLADLQTRGFLVSREQGSTRCYRFEPVSQALARSVEQLAMAYAERRYTIIDLIFSKPIDRLRVYADAFRFKKDDPDG